ncbi:hypothetical protein I5Q34_33540 [Streptomyces sp. AV19]|uniref:hypothetical protein n=1 Tax=Streptomyces sp. AV19 TaxID=2793068 RepID=UPI0018FE10F3|nr:hypothetical protein [Streptomyces sp. AV19]MBH1939126.1 hypothetical protein [Streptomyces sp. AV19]MDG4531663.1 hypothetical protein [Streptomyces sp. AV19]
MISSPILLLLVCTGAVAWLLAAAVGVGLLAVAVVRGVRAALWRGRRRGKHRALGGPVPSTAAEDEAALVEHAGLSILHLCRAEDRTTLHRVHADGARECWVCGTITEGAAQ